MTGEIPKRRCEGCGAVVPGDELIAAEDAWYHEECLYDELEALERPEEAWVPERGEPVRPSDLAPVEAVVTTHANWSWVAERLRELAERVSSGEALAPSEERDRHRVADARVLRAAADIAENWGEPED